MRKLLVTVILTMSSCFAWGGMEFDGVDDEVILNDAISSMASDTTGTISAWVRVDNIQNNGNAIFSATDGGDSNSRFMLKPVGSDVGGYSDGMLDIAISENGTFLLSAKTTSSVLTQGKWHHVVFRVTSGGNAMHVDGESVALTYSIGNANSTYWLSSVNNIDEMRLGSRVSSGSAAYGFDGAIDRFKYFPTALTAPEVRELYDSYANYRPNDGTNVIPPTADWIGARGYGDGQALADGSRIYDISGNGLHGYATNGVKQATAQTPTNASGYATPISIVKPRTRR